MHIKDWVQRITNDEQPVEGIIAYYFGLFRNEKSYIIYLVGSFEYDTESPDWAFNDDFEPKDKYLALPDLNGLEWEEVLRKVKIELEDILSSESLKDSFLGQAKAIAMGFDDGDIVILR